MKLTRRLLLGAAAVLMAVSLGGTKVVAQKAGGTVVLLVA